MTITASDIRKRNLKKIVDEQFNGIINQLATAVGRENVYFYDIFANRKNLGERAARNIENQLGLEPMALESVEDAPMHFRKFALINLYPNKFTPKISAPNSLGTNSLGANLLGTNQPLNNQLMTDQLLATSAIDVCPVSTATIEKHQWSKNNLCCFNSDDSMAPTIPENTKILVNTAVKEINNNKVYVIIKNNEVFFKRLFKSFENNNAVIFKSDNPKYPEMLIDLSKKNSDFCILGQVVLKLEEEI